jgi:uncharacterized protein
MYEQNPNINEIINIIINNYNPNKIILFGSYAKGTQNADSDLDIIIIKDTHLPKHKRSSEVRRYLIGIIFPIDIKVYTNSEFEQEISNKYSFLRDAMITSKVLYEKS